MTGTGHLAGVAVLPEAEGRPRAAPPASDNCPRCGTGFHCGAHGSIPCACTRIQLSAPQLQALRVRHGHGRCLCLACLAAVAAGQPVA